jgi:hypothetical protein
VSGARYEISIDGVVRTHRDLREIAVEAATVLKSKNPQSRVVVRDLITGTKTEIGGMRSVAAAESARNLM